MAAAVTADAPIRERLNWEPDAEQHQAIRRLWIDHSKAEDARDLQGLIDTLAPDCVYEIVPIAQRWEGHAGARAFYTTFLGAFPDVHFDLQDIVIGPQGVIEITRMTGTHHGICGRRIPHGVDGEETLEPAWVPVHLGRRRRWRQSAGRLRPTSD